MTTKSDKLGLDVKRKSLFSLGTEFIPYKKIQSVHAVRIGRREGLRTYHLIIRLKDGKKLAPGRWSKSPDEINDIAYELAKEIGCEVFDTPVYSMPNIQTAILAGAGAVLVYVIWYRVTVGQICLAMWHGNAPVIFIPFGFALILCLLRTRKN
jgi:hypothetical protein